MKKKSYLLLSLLLISCQKNIENVSIICPTGAPAIAFYEQVQNQSFTTNSAPKNIISMMTNSSDKDIIVIDTVSGINAINSGANFKIAATITFGNFFIASTGNDDNGELDSTDKIVLFGENQTPDYIFHYLYGDEFNQNIEYVGNAQDAAKVLASGKNPTTKNTIDYVFLAQPALFSVLNNKEAPTYQKASIYANVQELYKQKSNNKEMIQASIFVKNNDDETYNKKINNYLKSLKKSINNALDNPEIIDKYISKISEEDATSLYGINSKVAIKVLKDNNQLGLGYKNAFSIKDSIDDFIGLFNIEKTNEEIYYK